MKKEEVELKRDIQLEKSLTPDFLEEVYTIPGGERIKDCIQCGTCSGSCPAGYEMEYTPRQLFAMVRAGMRDEVLKSDTIWTCCSCYLCVVRCPRQIKITDIMYALKCLAIKERKYSKHIKAPVLAKNFVFWVNKFGRNQETYLTISFFFLTNIFKMLGQLPLATKLFFQNRLPIFPKKVKNLNQLKTIINRIEKLEEER